jgi:hypothetical protein
VKGGNKTVDKKQAKKLIADLLDSASALIKDKSPEALTSYSGDISTLINSAIRLSEHCYYCFCGN